MRIVVVNQPHALAPEIDTRRFRIGTTLDVSPALALLMTAVGWARPETRTVQRRRTRHARAPVDRRRRSDRRERGASLKKEKRA
jgi:hypothetical protein